MIFVAAECPKCGARLQLDSSKETGYCQYCGSQIVIQDAITLYKVKVEGQVKLEGAVTADSLMQVARRTYGEGNTREAYSIFTRVLELEPDNWEAVYYRGLCAGWQSTLANIRLRETCSAIVNAIALFRKQHDDPEKVRVLLNNASVELSRITDALFNLAYEHLLKYKDLTRSLSDFYEQCERVMEAQDFALSLLSDDCLAADSTGISKKNKVNILVKAMQVCSTMCQKVQVGTYVYELQTLGPSDRYRGILVARYDRLALEAKRLDPNVILPGIKRGRGCYIATTVYGSYNAPQVLLLRQYRDHVLLRYWLGRAFVRFYYLVSPGLAKRLRHSKWCRDVAKIMLDHIVGRIRWTTSLRTMDTDFPLSNNQNCRW